MIIPLKKLDAGAKLPTRGTADSSGLDLSIVRGIGILPGATCVVKFGIAVSLQRGFEGQIRGRSSLAKKGILCHLGTIDADYRGEIMATLTNFSGETFSADAGDRVAQLVIAPVALPACIEFAELDDTERGAGGFGSTGK